jgi:hypothetical protein
MGHQEDVSKFIMSQRTQRADSMTSHHLFHEVGFQQALQQPECTICILVMMMRLNSGVVCFNLLMYNPNWQSSILCKDDLAKLVGLNE